MKEKNKGITLIALVITIIVLLILAAISIATLTGNNGILTRANEAKEQTIVGKEKEEISTAYNGAVANNLEPKVTAEDLQGELDKLVGEGKTNVEEIEDGKLKVTFDTNHSYEVSNGQTTQLEDTEFTPSVDWSKILDEANKNPDSMKHKDQLESDLIGIGTDGNPVNMDYWKNIYMANDGTFGIGVKSGHGAYAYEKSYVGGVTSDGKIQGTIPQYIYNAATKKFVEVTELPGTFLRNEEIRIAPQIPSTVVFMGHTFYCCTNLEKGSEIPSGVGTVENDLDDKEYAMLRTYSGCVKLKEAPKILAEGPELDETFANCIALEKVTNIPNTVEELYYTFMNCQKLKSIAKIPSSVKQMRSTFQGCIELTGTIVIENADNINSYDNCFAATTKEITLQGNGLLEKFNSIAATGSAGNVKVDEANIIQPPQ